MVAKPENEEEEVEMTRPISIRIATKDYDSVEAIREILDERTGITPDRSVILRKAMRLGIEAFCKEQDLDLTAHAEKKKRRSRRAANA